MESEDIGVEDDKNGVQLWSALERHLEQSKPAKGFGDLRIRLHDAVERFRVITRNLQNEFDGRPNPGKVIGSIAQHFNDLGVTFEAFEKGLETSHVA